VKEKTPVAVRTLVEFACREGDITLAAPLTDRFRDGAEAHREIQASRPEGYRAEVPLAIEVEGRAVVLAVAGKADGVYRDGPAAVLEEIKSTDRSLGEIPKGGHRAHWAQAEIYAHMLAVREALPHVEIRLIYVRRKNGEFVVLTRRRSCEELAGIFASLVTVYLQWCDDLSHWRDLRDRSLDELAFPFPAYRPGQRELLVSAFRVMRDGGELFADAPTGIGKTAAVLYAAVKAIGHGHISQVFYLTAKTTQQHVAEETLGRLRGSQMRLKSITITAKTKICPLRDRYPEKPPCDPVICPYARGYYGRINAALRELYAHDALTREVVEDLGQKHTVCPFEYSLDMAVWCDLVVCDYNYLFDPRVRLQRFFVLRRGDYAFLVDEAHNLPDRAREMFSAQIDKKAVLRVKRSLKGGAPQLVEILSQFNASLLALRKEILAAADGANGQIRATPPPELTDIAERFTHACETYFRSSHGRATDEALVDLYYASRDFVRVALDYDERFATLLEAPRGGLRVKLACVDPSNRLRQALDRGVAAVFFSATLTPFEYYRDLLGGCEESDRLTLPSPFPRENLCVMLDSGVSTRYRDRSGSYVHVAARIHKVIEARAGNYMAFFPSYAYMRQVLAHFDTTGASDAEILVQSPAMSEEERRRFLRRFDDPGERTLLAFVVMGGIFAEGVDLVGDRLTGAIVVGVGLPMICTDRDIIRSYYDKTDDPELARGFRYAYLYPGMNRVLQAAGRVIRSESDRGVVLLIGDRFAQPQYERLCPPDWLPILRVRSAEDIAAELREFWRE
jgi:DNA excision repair protein ERCC-2